MISRADYTPTFFFYCYLRKIHFLSVVQLLIGFEGKARCKFPLSREYLGLTDLFFCSTHSAVYTDLSYSTFFFFSPVGYSKRLF